jgi:hypothetical protein
MQNREEPKMEQYVVELLRAERDARWSRDHEGVWHPRESACT